MRPLNRSLVRELWHMRGQFVAVAVVVALSYADKLVKDAVETLGPEFTQSEVTLGGVNISLLGGSAGLSDLAVGNPAGFSSDNAFSLGEMCVTPPSSCCCCGY